MAYDMFRLTERELWFKAEYERDSGRYHEKPMTLQMYEQISASKKKYYRDMEKFHEQSAAGAYENTIKEIDVNGDNIEILLHGRYSYPILHNHEYIEIAYVYSGKCRHFIEKQCIEMKEGDMCILAPRAMHAISAVEDNAIVIDLLISKKLFDDSFFQMLKGGEILSDFFRQIFFHTQVSPYIIFSTGEDTWIHDTIRKMYLERMKKDYLFQESEFLYIKQLFIRLIRRYEMFAVISNPIDNTTENNMVGLMGYINANYAHITLHETARFFGYNETYLSRLLQQYTGKKFSTVVSDIQMSHAKQMLETTDKSVTEIGAEVGCYDSSHFNRKFKAAFGVSPREYRKSKAR